MTVDFNRLLDPASAPPASPLAQPAPLRDPLGGGVPEVTRPQSRLTLPLFIGAAALVTAGFVYSVSEAGEAPATAGLETPPPPPPAPPLQIEPTPTPAPLPPVDPAPIPPSRASAPSRTAPAAAPDDGAAERAAALAAARRRSALLVGGAAETADGAPARARRLEALGTLVAEGTLVAGVLETAIDSTLPGPVRAVVAADVASFDGTRTLIPRGSRLVGQYRAGAALGQTRAFVLWTRLITPAGVSVALASPGTDAQGRVGLDGEVDHHFLRRFGAAILLSVVGSGAGALATSGRGDDITITAGDASRVAEVALRSSIDIPPTIRVRPGTPLRVLVARDLDFAGAAVP